MFKHFIFKLSNFSLILYIKFIHFIIFWTFTAINFLTDILLIRTRSARRSPVFFCFFNFQLVYCHHQYLVNLPQFLSCHHHLSTFSKAATIISIVTAMISIVVQLGPSPIQENKTLFLDQSRTLKSPSKPPTTTTTENF